MVIDLGTDWEPPLETVRPRSPARRRRRARSAGLRRWYAGLPGQVDSVQLDRPAGVLFTESLDAQGQHRSVNALDAGTGRVLWLLD